MRDALRSKHYGNNEEVKIAVKSNHLSFTQLEYMLSFKGGTQLLHAMVTMLRNSSVNIGHET